MRKHTESGPPACVHHVFMWLCVAAPPHRKSLRVRTPTASAPLMAMLRCGLGAVPLKTPGVLPDAGYVQPPIGGFVEHKSVNLRGSVRMSSFHEAWALPGSGRETLPDGTHRRLRRFYQNEGEELITQTFGRDRSALWKTARPPKADHPDAVMRELLTERLGCMAPDGATMVLAGAANGPTPRSGRSWCGLRTPLRSLSPGGHRAHRALWTTPSSSCRSCRSVW